jgi:D-amino-acid dehydrogenase
MGIRPSTPDSLPVIGTLPTLPGLYAAFGHGHYGMGMAPATGRIIAGLVDGGGDNQDWSSISPGRFLK